MSMRDYETMKYEEICVEEKYNQCMRHTIVRVVKTTNM